MYVFPLYMLEKNWLIMTKVISKKLLKYEKFTLLTIKNGIFKKIKKYAFSDGKRSS